MTTVGELLEHLRSVGVVLVATPAKRIHCELPIPAALARLVRLNESTLWHLMDLERRLDAGWRICGQQSDPTVRRNYEDHWLSLLEGYESEYLQEVIMEAA
jgi:hypothetical protein